MRTCRSPQPLLSFFATLLLALPMQAQSADSFNEYMTSPNVWRPATVNPPGVDGKGDLSLSIPIMTIPGRGGLDYPISFGYQSGVKVKQQSSWVGLGWSFDPGSLSRSVQGTLHCHANCGSGSTIDNEPFYVDFDELPNDGSSTIQPDMYYVTTPASSFSMVRSTNPFFQNAGSEFATIPFNAWKVEPGNAAIMTLTDDDDFNFQWTTSREEELPNEVFVRTNKADYPGFTLTDPSGNRYIFGLPTLGSLSGPYDAGTDNITEHYAQTWYLLAILGPDVPIDLDNINYQTDLDLTTQSGLPETATFNNEMTSGSWIRFYYSTPKASYLDSDHETFMSVRHLEKIVTPTHYAVFTHSSKTCEANCPPTYSSNIYDKLTQIALYSHSGDAAGGTFIKRVTLDQTSERFGSDEDDRLMLYGIDFFDSADAPLPGYRFDYHRGEKTIPMLVLMAM